MGKQGSKQLRGAQLAQLVHATQFDKRELHWWHRKFLHDFPMARVTLDELAQLYQAQFPFGDSMPFACLVLQAIDLDGNGTLEFSELMLALSVTGRGSLHDRLTWAFRLYDGDRDGFISRADMLAAVRAMYRMVGAMAQLPPDEATPELRVDKLFALMDTDRDGQLSLPEFLAGSQLEPNIVKALTIYDGLI